MTTTIPSTWRPSDVPSGPGTPIEEGTSLRRRATRSGSSPVFLALTSLAALGILAYAVFLLNPSNRGDVLPWLFVIISEAILVFHALMAMWTILVGQRNPRTFDFYIAKRFLYDSDLNASYGVEDTPQSWPMLLNDSVVTVDVFVTVYGEPLPVIRRTVVAAMQIRGAHRTWILDDGDSDEVRALAQELGCRYLRREDHSGAKAGNVNHALSVAHGDFYVIFDADFVAEPAFLEETLPFMYDGNVAFVQTPQTYGNLHNVISRGAGYMQTMFYRFIQPGRNQFNAAFCVGTNVLFRRAAIDEIGGMYTKSKSEDVWTSLMLHERGWKSVFIPEALAVGDAPDTIEAYSKQQLRWATGGFEILFTHNPLGPRRPLTIDQRFMYLVTATHYLTGIVPGILLFIPALEVFFDLRPLNLTVGPWAWVAFYGGFYLLQVLLAMLILGTFRWEVLLLAACSFPIYIKAFRNALAGVDQKWSVTGTTGRKASPFSFMIPQVLTFVFLACTLAVSIWRDSIMSQTNLASIWLTINCLVLGTFIVVAFREVRENRRTPVEGADDVADLSPVPVAQSGLSSAFGAEGIDLAGPGGATPVPRPRLPQPNPQQAPAATAAAGQQPRPARRSSEEDTITFPKVLPASEDFGHMPAPVHGRRFAESTATIGMDLPHTERPAASGPAYGHASDTPPASYSRPPRGLTDPMSTDALSTDPTTRNETRR